MSSLAAGVSAKKATSPKIEIPYMNIGDLDYKKLNFTKGVYKKVSGEENCIEGEYRLMRDPQTGRVFIKAGESVFINHLDQKVVNAQDRECVLSFFNLINESNELESTEIHSCSKPINISSIRNLKIKFEANKINYVFIFKDPTNNISTKTTCELSRQ